VSDGNGESKQPKLDAELERVFGYHAPTPDIAMLHEQYRFQCRELAREILKLPVTRERALAITKLEEVMMWTNACIARNHDEIEKMLERSEEEATEGASGDTRSEAARDAGG
jgi:hypothetical protein